MDDKKINEEELHFYYKREDRIQRAPQIVRSHYDGTSEKPPKGFFKSLVHTKSSRFLLGSIVLLVIMILFATNIPIDRNTGTIADVPFELSAFLFDGAVYVTLKGFETPISSDMLISVYFRVLDSNKDIITYSSSHSFFDGNEKIFRTTFAISDIIQYVECDISMNKETIQLLTKVEE